MSSNWIDQPKYSNVKSEQENSLIPKGSWHQCASCSQKITANELNDNLNLCPHCDHHFHLPFHKRIALLTDENSFEEMFNDNKPKDPLKFLDNKTGTYLKKLKNLREKGLDESVIVGKAKMAGKEIFLGVMVFEFIGGSMGTACGDKIYQIMKEAVKKKRPLLLITSSGGARMQEGVLSLMQMAKTSSGVEMMKRHGVPFLVVLTNPTFGGVSASFASLGDIILAEPGAKFGFAGERVIEATVKQKLPEGFQTVEFLKEKGFIDSIVHRKELKNLITTLLEIIDNKNK